MRGPLIVDTDVGGDPDDAVALVVAAAEPDLALVTTVDELGGRRARFARHLLDLLGRADVPVVAGADLGNTRMDCVPEPEPVDDRPTDVLGAVAAVCASTTGPVRWTGLGPATNLARILDTDLADRLVVTQMGGALRYRDPTRAEHNFRVDPEAAVVLLDRATRPTLVLSDTTFTPAIGIARDSPTHRRLTAPSAPAWAGLLADHLDRWFTRFHPVTLQHDALTLSLVLGLPFVETAPHRIAIDGIGRTTTAPDGHKVLLSVGADHRAFMAWLADRLS
ncbi:hypothetical protein GCM10022243_34510 [Saccharothrix violaceirubra]|uniref:Inosine-uridine nucleoside N-ribohydrolase n=1 Tax=Saccharothrix violaceirubra TaxID=413306 RepID=A0A7W7T4R6_9PSEU|nr:nucleoside hydrolase [Saccharothrix violaceirubra]MBB4966502.1 inosine-uridine nucleoside N-ribohydrolase [Saccharothrix violaceirubra]